MKTLKLSCCEISSRSPIKNNNNENTKTQLQRRICKTTPTPPQHHPRRNLRTTNPTIRNLFPKIPKHNTRRNRWTSNLVTPLRWLGNAQQPKSRRITLRAILPPKLRLPQPTNRKEINIPPPHRRLAKSISCNRPLGRTTTQSRHWICHWRPIYT